MVTRSTQSTIRAAAQQAPNGSIAFALAALTALALFAVLFPWFPGSQRLEEGATVDREVTAPREITYESDVMTERQRDAAAEAVPDVEILDDEIRNRQLAELDRVLAAIDFQRRDQTRSASARETAIQQIAGTDLSQRSAATLISVSDVRWSTMQSEARRVLSGTLAGTAIAPDEVEEARSQAAASLSPLLSSEETLALTEVLDPLVVPTLTVSQERTEALRRDARARVPTQVVTYREGQVIVPAGGTIDDAAFEAITMLDIRTGSVTLSAVVAAAIASVLGGAAFGAHLWVAKPRALRGVRRLVLFGLTLLVPVTAAKFAYPLILPDADGLYLALALPLATGAVVAAVLLDISTGVIVAVVMAGVVGFLSVAVPQAGGATGAELSALRLTLATAASSLAGLYVAARAERLQGYLGAGLAAAIASALVAVMVLMLDTERAVTQLAWIAGTSAVGGLMTAILAVGAFILLSRPFGIITRVELMELVQLNHPLLRRLQDEAPGTFQHSMLVGSLADRAADRIGADSLLVRVGAYYHDIGKLHSPGFFVENFGDGPNPHDNLDPLQSSRVIMRHVSAGVDLARKHNLPEAVVAFIPQHHGNRLVAYFYREAAKVKPDVDPTLFQYAGPKPLSRESALVMLADSCEASVRAATDRTADRIRSIVEGIIAERVEEGQFDECDISLRDLRVVADSFVQALSAVYHPRVEYPQPTRRELEARGRTPAVEEPARRREITTTATPALPEHTEDSVDSTVLSEDDS